MPQRLRVQAPAFHIGAVQREPTGSLAVSAVLQVGLENREPTVLDGKLDLEVVPRDCFMQRQRLHFVDFPCGQVVGVGVEHPWALAVRRTGIVVPAAGRTT